MVSEIFHEVFQYKSMGVIDPHGEASLDPRGLIGRIYVGDHKPLLYTFTKYISCGPHGFRDHKSFPIISLWELFVASNPISPKTI